MYLSKQGKRSWKTIFWSGTFKQMQIFSYDVCKFNTKNYKKKHTFLITWSDRKIWSLIAANRSALVFWMSACRLLASATQALYVVSASAAYNTSTFQCMVFLMDLFFSFQWLKVDIGFSCLAALVWYH